MSFKMEIAIIYFIIINIIAFMLMGIDKHKAKKHKWRIPEKNLFISALLFGSIGANLGMWVFRHKTKHIQFLVVMPLILIAQIVTGYVLFYSSFLSVIK